MGAAYFLLKVLITALIVAAVSELARRYQLWAALLASLPLTSLLAMIWIYAEQEDRQAIAVLSQDIFWLVLPSLIFFLLLPLMLRTALPFYLALAASLLPMLAAYWLMMRLRG